MKQETCAVSGSSTKRHTEILNIKRDASGKITELQVAVAFVQWDGYRPGHGQLAFRCPFCRTVHYHIADRPVFGIRNGLHFPKCHNPAYGLHSVALHKQLANSWYFVFVEVRDYRRAGPFPRNMHRNLKASANVRPSQEQGGARSAEQREEA